MAKRVDNMKRLEKIVARLPEVERVDIEAWGDEPTFRVRGKNFVFTDQTANGITVKLPKDEAAAVIATDSRAKPTGYGWAATVGSPSRWATTPTSTVGSRSKNGSAPRTRSSRRNRSPRS